MPDKQYWQIHAWWIKFLTYMKFLRNAYIQYVSSHPFRGLIGKIIIKQETIIYFESSQSQ